jgi:hemoglobin-like flavoprotein
MQLLSCFMMSFLPSTLHCHYESVGAALLATLEKGLGKDFTPPVREAWVICYTLIAREMIEGTGPREALP